MILSIDYNCILAISTLLSALTHAWQAGHDGTLFNDRRSQDDFTRLDPLESAD